jgi:hypothetical protein
MKTPSSQRIDQILASLDKVQRVPAPPFFYTRVRARLSQEQPIASSLIWLRPIPVVALLLILLALNFWLINTPVTGTTASPMLTEAAQEHELQALALEEHTLDQSIVDYEWAMEIHQNK